jgi:hypothetical protein
VDVDYGLELLRYHRRCILSYTFGSLSRFANNLCTDPDDHGRNKARAYSNGPLLPLAHLF